MRGAVDAEREIWTRARGDIDRIAHGTLNALDALEDCTKFEWTMTFTVLASVATIAAFPLTVTGLALSITVVGASSQVVAAAALDDPPKTEYGARTVNGVLDNMREAITRVTAGIREQETTIADALREAANSIRGHREGFVAPRPALTAATRATIQEELGDAY
ncbi:hypothetical protein [Cryptosporangium arvum]|uniref:hypothetical protein n=1 Tax=Cryptosporangium arvum TaxID=80871 RepID=UPI000568375C|nr:hypothetical protein [Cryptosporangium arvum]